LLTLVLTANTRVNTISVRDFNLVSLTLTLTLTPYTTLTLNLNFDVSDNINGHNDWHYRIMTVFIPSLTLT